MSESILDRINKAATPEEAKPKPNTLWTNCRECGSPNIEQRRGNLIFMHCMDCEAVYPVSPRAKVATTPQLLDISKKH